MKKPPKGIGLYIKKLADNSCKYESRLWNPYLKRIGKKKRWNETDLNQVIILHQKFKQEYIDNNFDLIKPEPKPKIYQPEMILECAAWHEKFLNDDPEIVPAHKMKSRGKHHIDNNIFYLKAFLNVLKSNGYKLSHTHITAVNDEAVSFFYDHLEARYQAGEIGEVSWNKYIKACRFWLKTLINTFDFKFHNPFDNVTVKIEITDPQFLEPYELNILLGVINEADGWGQRGKDKRTNYYRHWLKDFFIISAMIGGRPNEITNLRWSDVAEDYIHLKDSKNSNRTKSEKINYVFIHPQLAEVLAPLRSKSIGDDDFIISPADKNRKHLQSVASHAFSHFLKQTDINKNVTLNNLRHTYVNAVFNIIGEAGLSVHHSKETAIKHYLSKKKKVEVQRGKVLFPELNYTL